MKRLGLDTLFPSLGRSFAPSDRVERPREGGARRSRPTRRGPARILLTLLAAILVTAPSPRRGEENAEARSDVAPPIDLVAKLDPATSTGANSSLGIEVTPRTSFRNLFVEVVDARGSAALVQRAIATGRNEATRLTVPLSGAGPGTAWTVRVRGWSERGIPFERARAVRIPELGGPGRFEAHGAGGMAPPVHAIDAGGGDLLVYPGRRR